MEVDFSGTQAVLYTVLELKHHKLGKLQLFVEFSLLCIFLWY